MKKTIKVSLLSMLVLSVMLLGAPGNTFAKKNLEAGTVVKGKGLSTLYYIGEDGKRYVFPNDKTYFSWFDDFTEVEEIEMDELYEYSLGGNARYKPGKLLVKITTDPKVYAVSSDGKLRWIKSEEMAKYYYGDNWNKMIDDVPDSFFTDYEIGEDIDDDDDYSPDEEEEEVPTISHNRGWLAKKVVKRVRNTTERRCAYLANAVNRLQIRAELWGLEVPELGEDYLSTCVNSSEEEVDEDSEDTTATSTSPRQRKVTICHNGNTISIAVSALRAHLKKGYRIGACTGDTNEEEEEAEETDETAPVISNVNAEATNDSVVITWTTDENSDSSVEYADESITSASTTSEESDTTDVTSHSIEISNLDEETTYYYIVKSEDASGNVSESSEFTFTTSEMPDETAPVISAISVTASGTVAVITWATDEETDSKVSYAIDSIASSSSVSEVSNSEYVTDHSIELTGLATSTTYYFTVESSDVNDNTSVSTESTFDVE